MINNKSVLGIIPARGKSKGLSRKNIVSLGRKPLIAWIIKAALKSKFIDKVIVSTDDKKIADVAKNYRAEVPFIRPSKLATDNSKTFPVIKHAINFLKSKKQNFDYVVLLEPTSPLTTNKDIDEALERLVRQRKIADAIVSVSRIEHYHPSFNVRVNRKGLISPYRGTKFQDFRRQEIEDLYFFDGSLYISALNALLKKKGFLHSRTLSYKVPKWKALEIDDFVDLLYAEKTIASLKKIKRKN